MPVGTRNPRRQGRDAFELLDSVEPDVDVTNPCCDDLRCLPDQIVWLLSGSYSIPAARKSRS